MDAAWLRMCTEPPLFLYNPSCQDFTSILVGKQIFFVCIIKQLEYIKFFDHLFMQWHSYSAYGNHTFTDPWHLSLPLARLLIQQHILWHARNWCCWILFWPTDCSVLALLYADNWLWPSGVFLISICLRGAKVFVLVYVAFW